MTEIVFIIEDDAEGGYRAEAAGAAIFAEAEDGDSLCEQVRDAVRCHDPDEHARPKIIRLQLVHDEMFAA